MIINPMWLMVENASIRFRWPLPVAFDRADNCRQDSHGEKDRAQSSADGGQRNGKHRPVHASHRIQAKLHHHAGEQDADWCWRNRMGIGQPKMKRKGGGLYEKSGNDEQERHGHKHSAGRVIHQRLLDSRKIQHAGMGIDDGDACQGEISARVLLTAKLRAPCSGPASSALYPHSVTAAAPINSNQTNRLKRSPVRHNPHMPARNTSMIA